MKSAPVEQYAQAVPQPPATGLSAGSRVSGSGGLQLTPLRPCHWLDFFRRYDADIAEWCNLPDFDNGEEEWLGWLAECTGEPRANLFAVEHGNLGFIGAAGLDVFREIGFFYYWLGADFQGRGLGTEALRILLEWGMRHKGMRCCYAKAYESNIASKKAMAKAGFRPLPLKAFYPDEEDDEEEYEEEHIYYRGEYKTDRRLFHEINRFFAGMDYEIRARLWTSSRSNAPRPGFGGDETPPCQA